MAKALRTAAFVVGAVALVASGVGALAGAGIIGATAGAGAAAGATAGIFGVSAATLTAVGAIAGAAAGILTLAAGSPKGSIGGSATQFKIDKDAGMPIAIGRTYSGGNVVHRQFYGAKNSLESWVTVHSIGPVRSLGPLLINKVAAALAGTAITGSYAGYMWLDQQLGACPEVRALAGPQGPFPGWSGASKLSGLAADLWTLKFDEKGKVYPNGVPQRGRIVEGVYVYDPRLDDTYPGGAGACRLGQEATYVWSENPALHAITWAFGRYQNGVLIAGGGMTATGIDMAPFVDWANTCEANDWRAGGIVYTASDNSWDILKMIAQAGGGEVFPVGAQLSCSFNAPRVSIGTITSDDIMGDVDAPGTASRRARRNTVIPRVRLETHGWEEVPLDAIPIPDHVAVDGGSRPTEIAFPLVQQVDQGAQLGLYALFNGRELDGIVLPAKVYAIGYRPGDCLTVDIPEAALTGRDVVVRQREIEGSTMGVTLTCRSETHAKHTFCLGKTGKAPPTPDLTVPPSYPVENPTVLQLAIKNSWVVEISAGINVVAADAAGTVTIANHTRRYADRDVAVQGATIATSLVAGTIVSIGYDDPDRVGGVVTFHAYEDENDAFNSAANPARHYVQYVVIPESGTSTGGGGGAGGGREGACVTDDTPVLMANATRTGAGETMPASAVSAGEWIWTQHEVTREWGAYQVSDISFHDADVFAADGLPHATGDHQFDCDGWWTKAKAVGQPAGRARVAKITVDGARTYVTVQPSGERVLNHNIKNTQPDQ